MKTIQITLDWEGPAPCRKYIGVEWKKGERKTLPYIDLEDPNPIPDAYATLDELEQHFTLDNYVVDFQYGI